MLTTRCRRSPRPTDWAWRVWPCSPLPACVTVKVCPATVKVPMRCVPFGFALALKLVEPLPEPLVGVVMVSQLALLVAVQAQPVASVNADDPVPPVAATD